MADSIVLLGKEVALRQRFTYSQPVNKQVVTTAGVNAIIDMLTKPCYDRKTDRLLYDPPNNHRVFFPMDEGDWSWQWVIQKGKYAGTLPKRIAAFYFKQHSLSLDPQFLGMIGEVAKANIDRGEEFTLDFTNKFDWRDGDFGDYGSCFWGDRRGARLSLQDEGGLAVRFWCKLDELDETRKKFRREHDYHLSEPTEDGYVGIARAWVLPERMGMPVLVFNGYGFSGNATLIIARLVATWAGHDYKKLVLYNNGDAHGDFWINGGTSTAAYDGHGYGDTGVGYAISTPQILDGLTDLDLRIPEWEWTCVKCRRSFTDTQDLHPAPDHEDNEVEHRYCGRCFRLSWLYCDRCGRAEHADHAVRTHGNIYCAQCIETMPTCPICQERRPLDRSYATRDPETGRSVHLDCCADCANNMRHCRMCDRILHTDGETHVDVQWQPMNVWESARVYCPDCATARNRTLSARHARMTVPVTTPRSLFDLNAFNQALNNAMPDDQN